MVAGENETKTNERGRTFNMWGVPGFCRAELGHTHRRPVHWQLSKPMSSWGKSFDADVRSSGRVKIEGGTKFGLADLAVFCRARALPVNS